MEVKGQDGKDAVPSACGMSRRPRCDGGRGPGRSIMLCGCRDSRKKTRSITTDKVIVLIGQYYRLSRPREGKHMATTAAGWLLTQRRTIMEVSNLIIVITFMVLCLEDHLLKGMLQSAGL